MASHVAAMSASRQRRAADDNGGAVPGRAKLLKDQLKLRSRADASWPDAVEIVPLEVRAGVWEGVV